MSFFDRLEKAGCVCVNSPCRRVVTAIFRAIRPAFIRSAIEAHPSLLWFPIFIPIGAYSQVGAVIYDMSGFAAQTARLFLDRLAVL